MYSTVKWALLAYSVLYQYLIISSDFIEKKSVFRALKSLRGKLWASWGSCLSGQWCEAVLRSRNPPGLYFKYTYGSVVWWWGLFMSSSDYHVRKPWRWGLGKPLRHEVFKPWYNNCIDIFIWLLVPVNDLSLGSEVAPGLSAVILGQRKDELSQMQTNKFSRGKDNPPWLCYTSREWQSTANILPSLLPNLLSWVRWWPAPSWCLLSTINSQELLWLSFLSAQVSTCSLPGE